MIRGGLEDRQTAIAMDLPSRVVAGRRRQIRPCMVSFYFYPDYSGSAVQALNLSRHLHRMGMQPLILAANLSGSAPSEVVHGIPVVRVPVDKRAPIATFWWSAARYLWRHRCEFDIIHAHGTVQHGIVSLFGQIVGKPTILKVAMADSDLAFQRQGRIAGRIARFTVGRFSRYIATTEAIAMEFEAQGLDTMRVRRIPNGVDTDTFAPVVAEEKEAIRSSLGLPPGPIVTCVAIVQERKNIDGALRIWLSAVQHDAPGHLAIVGPVQRPDGPFIRSLQAFIDTHGLTNRVSFLGRRDPIAPFLRASDVFLFPSRQEGMPNAVLEAMACGLPCLVSKSAGVQALIRDGVDGYVIEPLDEAVFSARLISLLLDSAERNRMGHQARRRIVANYSLEGIARQYAELYDEVLNQERHHHQAARGGKG